MDDLFSFGDSPLEQWEQSLQSGDRITASRLLAQLEGESEWELYEIFDRLDAKGVELVLDDIPLYTGDGETALRLRREKQLVENGGLPGSLEENDPLRLYLEDLSAIPVCGDLPELEQALQEVNATGNDPKAVYDRVFHLCISRAVELAGEYAGKGVLLADLIQEGSTGLWGDMHSYSGGSLEQFRDARLRHHMERAIIAQACAAGVGQKLRQALEDYRSVDERLLTELGRNPTLEEIAQAMHLEPQQAAIVAQMVASARDLNRVKAPEKEEQPEEEEQAVEDTAYFQMRQRIADLLSGLDETSAKLLTMRYGLEGGAPMTPQQVGSKLGMTPEEVVAAEAAALSKLRTQS